MFFYGFPQLEAHLPPPRYEALKKLLEEKKAEAEKLSLKHTSEPAIDLGHPVSRSWTKQTNKIMIASLVL